MRRFTRTLLSVGLALGAMLANVADVEACGGGGYRPRYSSYPRPYYPQPAYRPQPQPVYYPAPTYPQPIASQQPMRQPVAQSVPGTFGPPTGQTASAMPQAPAARPGAAAPSAPGSFGPAASQSVSGRPQMPVGSAAPSAPATGSAPAASQAPSTSPAESGADAEMSALEALAEMTGRSRPQATVAETPAETQTPAIAGKWTARLDNGAVVQLTLQSGGLFNWTATNKSGQVSTFQGTYTVAGGSLTLIRSNDNTKLEGSMSQIDGNRFNFKLSGASDKGLDFVRS